MQALQQHVSSLFLFKYAPKFYQAQILFSDREMETVYHASALLLVQNNIAKGFYVSGTVYITDINSEAARKKTT